MFQTRSIALRLVFAISATAASASAILGLIAAAKQDEVTSLALAREMEVQYQSVIASFDAEARTATAVSTVVANLPAVQDAQQREDRDALAAILGAAQAAAKAQGMGPWSFTKPPGITTYRVHDPKVFGDDVRQRRRTVALVNEKRQAVTGIEPGRGNLGIWGVVPMLKGDQFLGAVDVGVTFGPNFVERIKKRFGVEFAVHYRDGDQFTTMGSSLPDKTLASAEEMMQAFGGTIVLRRGSYNGQPVAIYLAQLKNFAGEPVAVVELVKDVSVFVNTERSTRWYLMGATAVVLLAAIGIALLLGRGLSRPIDRLREAMGRLSKGDTATEIPGRDRRDELGSMAEAVAVFKESMLETERLRARQEASRQEAEAERKALMAQLADTFEASVRGVVDTVTTSAAGMKSTAQSMSSTAEETQRQSLVVSSASEQTSTNVQTVATATEELSSSIAEIARQTAEAARVAGEVAEDGRRTDGIVSGLAAAASRIGEVVALIHNIASQTNLLALNATIEAARAGDAGKGFAVVASEVKALANQTAKATEDIQSQVAAIQEETGRAVDAIRAISGRVEELTGITASVSGAVEEQGAATQEIARNVQQAAQGTQDVSRTIGSVTAAASETGAAAALVLSTADDMARQSGRLREEADRFLASIRAA